MYRVFGRVVSQGTHLPVSSLVVVAFAQEAVSKKPSKSSNQSTRAAAAKDKADALGIRLGSALTDADGNFELRLEDVAGASKNKLATAKLTLAVMMPDDLVDMKKRPTSKADSTALYVTQYSREGIAKDEAYVIRLPEKLIQDHDLVTQPSATTDSHDLALSLASSVEKTWQQQNSLKHALSAKRKSLLDRKRLNAVQAKEKVKDLSGLSRKSREHPLFAKSSKDVDETHHRAIQEGLRSLGKYTGKLKIRLTADEIRDLGLQEKNGELVGAIRGDRLESLLDRRGARTILQRGPGLLERINALEEVIKSIDSAGEVNSESEGSSTASEPNAQPVVTTENAETLILDRIYGQVQDLKAAQKIASRADSVEISKSIESLDLTGGAADATAFHDIKVLQMAFKDVWTEAFDGNLKNLVERLYQEVVQHYEALDQTPPTMDSLNDIEDLKQFLKDVQDETAIVPGIGGVSTLSESNTSTVHAAEVIGGGSYSDWVSSEVQMVFPEVTTQIWNLLSDTQQMVIERQASLYKAARTDTAKAEAKSIVAHIIRHPDGTGSRLAKLMYELEQSLCEKYTFDLFAPNSYNYGIMLTYRQKWEPLSYQAGNLISTIPLAPGETRKYSKKRVRKESRTEKSAQKDSFFRSDQASETDRAEVEIMRKATSTTNFKSTSKGTFSMEMFSIEGTTDFSTNQEMLSSDLKKNFHEATIKAAEEYRKEHSLEIESSGSSEFEETASGEISNPNNEITVTYLFYELQRRYRVTEQLYRAQPVIMVAQEMPAPHEINEAFLITHQWILARSLLDESLRPGLEYLTSGFAGDEVSTDLLRAQWMAQRDAQKKIEQQVSAQMLMRDSLRNVLTTTAQGKSMAQAFEMPLSLKIVTLGLAPDPTQHAVDALEAQRAAAETRLGYVEEALADGQRKLLNASDTFQKATQEYAAALQKKYLRRVAIDQLRVHVKQNILHYMQIIWDCEPPDQRFFRLYNKKVKYFPTDGTQVLTVTQSSESPYNYGTPVYGSPSNSTSSSGTSSSGTPSYGTPTVGAPVSSGSTVSVGVSTPVDQAEPVDLIEIADLDNPLGYKGNYIIFPLKKPCHITTFMLQEYVDDDFGVRDPDTSGDFPLHEVVRYVRKMWKRPDISDAQRNHMRDRLNNILRSPRTATEEIIVPTGQLFIEALPGRHPLLEDFKLRHRMEDVRKVQAEVRRAEMENLRFAARLVAGEHENPTTEKRIIVDKSPDVVITPD